MAYRKYRNQKVKSDGYTFDSIKEYERYRELTLLEKAGEITQLEVHPRFTLMPGFVDCVGKRETEIKYKADFRYIEHGKVVVEDVKSPATLKARDWPLRRKMFKSRYPHIELREIVS